MDLNVIEINRDIKYYIFCILELDFIYNLNTKPDSMKSLIQFFEESVEKFSNNIYLWEKPNEKYEGTTYGEQENRYMNLLPDLLNSG